MISLGRFITTCAALCGAAFISHAAFGEHAVVQRLGFAVAARFGGQGEPGAFAGAVVESPVDIRARDYEAKYPGELLSSPLQNGAAVADVDGDGISDIYLITPGTATGLWRGVARGKFANITESAGVRVQGAVAAAFGDYDHSGRPSLFVAGVHGLKLYRNTGTRSFSDVTQAAGFAGTPRVLYTNVVLGDFNDDGYPDLLLSAYTDLNHAPSKAVFTFPNDFPGVVNRLFRNNRDGTFADVTGSSGLAGNPGRTRKTLLADFDGDGRLDILMLRDNKPPALFLNRGEWKFEEATWDAGDDLTTHAFFEGAVADFNQDGKPDLALWGTHAFRILINEGRAVFESLPSDIPDPAIGVFTLRGVVADLDGDGLDDVLTVDGNGQLRMFANSSGTFHEVSFALPDATVQDQVIPARLNRSRAVDLIAVERDGCAVLLRSTKRGTRGRPELAGFADRAH